MKRRNNIYLFVTLLIVLIPSCSKAQGVKMYSYKIEQVLPHDVTAYTQGLFFYNGELYESTGQYGESTMRKVDLSNGKVIRRENFENKYFIEGSCVVNGKLYILTWREGLCFVYDIKTWKRLGQFRNLHEGWGLTTDGNSLIMSDGSSQLFFLDPETFVEKRSVTVKLKGTSMSYLNELEYIDGKIWANVYESDDILIIDPQSGTVTGVVDCRNILPAYLVSQRTDVLNGIAYDENTKSIYITGKYWPKMYKISIKEKK